MAGSPWHRLTIVTFIPMRRHHFWKRTDATYCTADLPLLLEKERKRERERFVEVPGESDELGELARQPRRWRRHRTTTYTRQSSKSNRARQGCYNTALPYQYSLRSHSRRKRYRSACEYYNYYNITWGTWRYRTRWWHRTSSRCQDGSARGSPSAPEAGHQGKQMSPLHDQHSKYQHAVFRLYTHCRRHAKTKQTRTCVRTAIELKDCLEVWALVIIEDTRKKETPLPTPPPSPSLPLHWKKKQHDGSPLGSHDTSNRVVLTAVEINGKGKIKIQKYYAIVSYLVRAPGTQNWVW